MDNKRRELEGRIIDLLSEWEKQYLADLKNKGGSMQPEDLFSMRMDVIKHVESVEPGALDRGTLIRIFNELVTSTFMRVTPFQVAYLGPVGTFTHIALLEIFGEQVEALPQKTISDVFNAVESGKASFGVVPIENSTEGAVTYTLDEFLETDLRIVSEKFLRISYSLVSLCNDISQVKKIYSHPQPLGQCKAWLRANLPNAEVNSVSSTAMAAETTAWDKYSAAIASGMASRLYNLNVLVSGIEDSRQNFTRFLVLGKKDNPLTGNDKTSIVCALKDRPGALYNLLRPFADAGINMTKIESRPDKKKMWEYNFFIDFIGHRDENIIKETLEKMKEETIFLKVLGSYQMVPQTPA